MENFKTAKLFDAGGDLSKRWFVFYQFISPETGKYRRFQLWVPHKILTASGRRDKGHEIIKTINNKLKQGFNPFAHHISAPNPFVDENPFACEGKTKAVISPMPGLLSSSFFINPIRIFSARIDQDGERLKDKKFKVVARNDYKQGKLFSDCCRIHYLLHTFAICLILYPLFFLKA
ncbi:MAG: hypothetical protein NT004_18495 [Bacteroidetes bacterium]|nr:hypothetical protein [Bacteroidota bacterium]